MSSEPMRDPRTDPLLKPASSALLIIDYQPNQVNTVKSTDTGLLLRNIVSVARLGKAYGLPIVLSTVNAAAGQGPTLLALKDVLTDNVEIDRSQINSWEDVEFREAVEATGRKKLILCASGLTCASPSRRFSLNEDNPDLKRSRTDLVPQEPSAVPERDK